MSFDKCVHLCKYYLNQYVKYFHHLKNYFGASSHQSTSHPQTQATIGLLSVNINDIQIFRVSNKWNHTVCHLSCPTYFAQHIVSENYPC